MQNMKQVIVTIKDNQAQIQISAGVEPLELLACLAALIQANIELFQRSEKTKGIIIPQGKDVLANG